MQHIVHTKHHTHTSHHVHHHKHGKNKNLVMVALMIAVLAVTVFLIAKGVGLNRNSGAYTQGWKIGPFNIYCPTGTPGYESKCFELTNITSSAVVLSYHLDCWDETKCADTKSTVTFQPGQTITLSLGNPCSVWQLDLNWTGRTDGNWDWGGVIQKGNPCGSPSPSPVTPAPSTPTPPSVTYRCDYAEWEAK